MHKRLWHTLAACGLVFWISGGIMMADDKTAGALNSTDPDLKRFKARGGKLIIYHGWSDAAIPPQTAIDYYKSVVAKMGAKDSDTFVRLFMAPGVQHCGGGPGPNMFGHRPFLLSFRCSAQHI